MTAYEMLRALHIAAVTLSGALFALRAGWMLGRPELLGRRWVRIVPHVVDTVLLASAITLLVLAGWSPTQPWLLAKIGALVVYIVLGTIALKHGRSRSARVAALLGAFTAFAYIVSVALTKSPVGFLGGI